MGPEAIVPNPWMIVPFGVLLLIIAVGPVRFPGWWAKHYPKVAYSLGAITLVYYLFGLHAYERVLHTGHEYVSFIILIGALFVVSGGIHINVKGEATPLVNTVFLFIGAVLANVLGTTGASMLLIRPWIRMNHYRITGYHIVFFIFIVSNVGGCLTPIGDPPLFLGYLKGVPFWWVAEHCWPIWLVGVGFLLAVFFVLDLRNYRKAPRQVSYQQTAHEEWRFQGLWNTVPLAVILAAVFINEPVFLREGLMVAAALGSYFLTSKSVHAANHFDFHPIKEVAILFVGIFATMLPALDWLQANAGAMKSPTPAVFYWASGCLSSCLDNAPTYLSFLSAIFGRFVDPDTLNQVQHLVQTHGADLASVVGAHAEDIQHAYAGLAKYHAAELAAGTLTLEQIRMAIILGSPTFNHYLLAISVGAVFFGANTYIGNGPNFLVKSIADHQKVHAPGFTEFILRYSIPFMLPMLVLVWLLFF